MTALEKFRERYRLELMDIHTVDGVDFVIVRIDAKLGRIGIMSLDSFRAVDPIHGTYEPERYVWLMLPAKGVTAP